MASVMAEDSNQSALDLLKPDPPMEAIKGEEEDELEALRLAALKSIKPKKSSYKVQAHPVRSNLLSIVPVEEPKPEPLKSNVNKPVISPNRSGSRSKFDRHTASRSESDSEEEIEVEEEVTATESEAEEENPKAKDSETNKKEPVKKLISTEDDVLNVDCTEEVDEFTSFLNELEDKPSKTEPAVKKKKTKIILVKKKVKKVRPVRKSPSDRRPRSRSWSRSRSRSPHIRWKSPTRRRYSPGGRYSPPYRRRYSRSPSPRRYRPRSPRGPRYRSPRPRSRSPRGGYSRNSPHRRYRTPTLSPPPSKNQRGGSAPRQLKSENAKAESEKSLDKSKSLPPQNDSKDNKGQQKQRKSEEELQEEKLKRLPTPEREKLLQRRKKFEANMPVKPVAKKISLKGSGNETGEAISLSVDDTLDIFDESAEKTTNNRGNKQNNKGNSSFLLSSYYVIY